MLTNIILAVVLAFSVSTSALADHGKGNGRQDNKPPLITPKTPVYPIEMNQLLVLMDWT
jgi:hypothetical protein